MMWIQIPEWYRLDIGEELIADPTGDYQVLRVPGGWVFTQRYSIPATLTENVTSCFIPYNEEGKL